MQSATMASLSTPVTARVTARSAVLATPLICRTARPFSKSSVFGGQRNSRSPTFQAVWSTGGRCGPTFQQRWGGTSDMQRSFEKWAEQASNSMWFPVDVEETAQEYTFVADVPGLGKKDIKVQINKDRELSISGERQQQQPPSSNASTSGNTVQVEGQESSKAERKVHRRRQERRFGSFKRSWTLPEDADISQIKASVEQGVLTLKVSRVQPAEPEVTNIPIS